MSYLAVKAKCKKLLAENEKTFAMAFAKINALLMMPAGELDRPAIVKRDPRDSLSYLFRDDDGTFGKVLIKPNPGYFKSNLPKSSPQFIQVYVIANHKEKIAAKFMADIMKAVGTGSLSSFGIFRGRSERKSVRTM